MAQKQFFQNSTTHVAKLTKQVQLLRQKDVERDKLFGLLRDQETKWKKKAWKAEHYLKVKVMY
jgi:hypothetical protein